MSLSDHLTHQGSSRRWAYVQQSQQDLSSPRPAHHLNLDRAYSYEKDSIRKSSTTPKHGTRSRNNSRLPRTLKDAFEATSQTVIMDPNERFHNEPNTNSERTPSPNSRRHRSSALHSPSATLASPVPDELLEAYQQIYDADDLADLVSEDDLEIPQNIASRRNSRERRRRRGSPGSLDLRYTQGDDNLGPVFSYLDDITDDHGRGKLSTYKRDEERLNHATTSQSPVFSKAKVGSKAEGLQRRESDPQEEQPQSLADEDGIRLALNVPKSWGNRKNHRQWLSSITDSPRGEITGRLSERERKARFESRSRSPRLTTKSPSQPSHEYREGREHKSERSRLGAPPSNGLHNTSRARSRSVGRGGVTGDAIPDTPITVYKSNFRDSAQKTRSDSRDLLRKLARTESPNQVNTPEQQKPQETSLPQKTPVVIGAWVDTPITVKNAQANEDDETKEIESPSKTVSKPASVPVLHSSDSKSSLKRESTEIATSEVQTRKPTTKPLALSEKSANVDSKKPPTRELIKPQLPKSALEDVIQEAKSKTNPMLELGDDTISSLEGIMNSMDKRSSRFVKVDEEKWKKELAAIESDIDRHQTDDKPRQQLDQMNSKIQSIIRSIHDARTGLDVLENTFASGSSPSTHVEGYAKRCESCGIAKHDHSDERVYLAIPIPRLWIRQPVSQRLRLTSFGWAIAIFSLWYISESTMCDYYCHPTIAEVCDGYCLQPDAPQFPFTLPTMLWRWSHLSAIFSPLITILIALFRLAAQVFGFWDGYIDNDNLSDFQWSSASSPSGDIPVGSSEYEEGNGVFGLWSSGIKKASTHTSTMSSASSMPTILQNIIEDPQSVDDSMDGDEIL